MNAKPAISIHQNYSLQKKMFGKGSKNNSEIFHLAPDPPPPLVEKYGLHNMKQILYDMGPLTLVR